jgi:hypothetical protein
MNPHLCTIYRIYPQGTPSYRGAAQTSASVGKMRSVGVDTGRAADRTQPEHHHERRRVTVSEAADILGITAEAVRTRIKRGRLDSIKDPPRPGGTVYVLLEADQTRPNIDSTSQGQDQTTDQTHPDAAELREELVNELRDRVRYLEQALEEEREARTEEHRRHDTLMAQLMQRIPELEPPPLEPQESPVSPGPSDSPTEGAEGPREEASEEPAERRSWWSRIFGE